MKPMPGFPGGKRVPRYLAEVGDEDAGEARRWTDVLCKLGKGEREVSRVFGQRSSCRSRSSERQMHPFMLSLPLWQGI